MSVCFVAEGWSGRQFVERIEREGPGAVMRFLSTFADDRVEWDPGPAEPEEGVYRNGGLELRWRPRTGIVYLAQASVRGTRSRRLRGGALNPGTTFGRIPPAAPAPGFPAAAISSLEELRAYLATPEIRCLECGGWFRFLTGSHLRTHGMTPRDYKRKFNIPVTAGMVCRELSEELSRRLRDAREDGMPLSPLTSERAREVNAGVPKSRPSYTGSKGQCVWSDDAYNEFLIRVSGGRAMFDVGRDADMPSANAVMDHARKNKAFAARLAAARRKA